MTVLFSCQSEKPTRVYERQRHHMLNSKKRPMKKCQPESRDYRMQKMYVSS